MKSKAEVNWKVNTTGREGVTFEIMRKGRISLGGGGGGGRKGRKGRTRGGVSLPGLGGRA
jgi:hypothetical protein